MAYGGPNNQRIIPLEEGWNDEIKVKVSPTRTNSTLLPAVMRGFFLLAFLPFSRLLTSWKICLMRDSVQAKRACLGPRNTLQFTREYRNTRIL